MRRDYRFWKAAVAGMALLMAVMLGGAARGEDYGPGNAAAALQQLSRWRCSLNLGCPISGAAYAALTAALSGDREAQYRLARLLQRGDGIQRDVRGATGWHGKAAEQGHVAAALELNRLRHEGADVPADEIKIAAALRLEVDKGDRDAMRALADMEVYGRGLPRDAEQGTALLRRAAEGSAAAAEDLSNLFLRDAPGIPRNPAEGFRWMAESARLGNAAAMLNLGSMYFNFPSVAMRDPTEGYRWLMRAALVDNPAAQEMLSGVLAQGAMVGARTVIPPDPIAADMWLRLAARSPFHDNASQRLQIESNMTAAQLAEAKDRAAAWRPSSVDEVLAMTIPLPAVAGTKPPWPPELHGRALDLFKEAGENPPLWLRMPDFARNEAVMSAITAIAEQCEGSGNKHCAEICRQQLDYVVPPIKPGGVSTVELARYLREHPEVSPVRAMRKEAATPEESMHFWALCANGIEGAA